MANPVVIQIPSTHGAKLPVTAIAQNAKAQLRLTLPTQNGKPTAERRVVLLRFDKDVLLSDTQDQSDASGAGWYSLPANEAHEVIVIVAGSAYKDIWVLCSDAAGTTQRGWTP